MDGRVTPKLLFSANPCVLFPLLGALADPLAGEDERIAGSISPLLLVSC